MTTTDQTEIIAQLRERLTAAQEQVSELKAQVAGDAEGFALRLQRRAERQRAALDRLNRRVLSQRLHLRTINELGRGLTREEYLAAKEAHPLSERIDDYEVLV